MPKTCLFMILTAMFAVSAYFGWVDNGPSVSLWQKVAYFTLGFIVMTALLYAAPGAPIGRRDKSGRS